MHPVEIENTLKTLTLIVDTREQDTARARRRFARIGLPYIRKALNFGDYSCFVTLPDGTELDFSGSVSIERKMDLDEIIGCFTRHRARFAREFERAKEHHAKLYLLIENGSWAPLAAKVMKGMLEGCKNLTFLEPTVTIMSALSEKSSPVFSNWFFLSIVTRIGELPRHSLVVSDGRSCSAVVVPTMIAWQRALSRSVSICVKGVDMCNLLLLSFLMPIVPSDNCAHFSVIVGRCLL